MINLRKPHVNDQRGRLKRLVRLHQAGPIVKGAIKKHLQYHHNKSYLSGMKKVLCLAILLASFNLHAKFTNDSDEIKIAIGKALITAEFIGDFVVTPRGHGGFRPNSLFLSKATITSISEGFDLDGAKIDSTELLIKSHGPPIIFNNHKYSGEFVVSKSSDGKILVVNKLPLEEYLVGIVASEMPANWPIEAIKAQAVTARTYAIYQRSGKNGDYDLEATVLDQVYEGIPANEGNVRQAVEETSGATLSYHGKPFKSFFHSLCGGQTESAQNVWGDKNLFPTIKDEYCLRAPNSKWMYVISKPKLASKLNNSGFPATTITSIEIESRKDNPRVATITIGTGTQTFFLQGSDFRKIVGYNQLRSTWFNASMSGDTITFSGRGYGHGVGMCQWGAKGMAEAGRSYKEILEHYYPGSKLVGKR